MTKKKKHKKKIKKQTQVVKYDANEDLNAFLNSLAEKRTGGAINIRGVGFQLLYACYKILKELDDESDTSIRLEGIEDIDVIHVGTNEYIQLKSSINTLDAGAFWKLGVIQNFLEVYRNSPDSKLCLVHNSTISKGNLLELAQKKLSEKGFSFWSEKIISHLGGTSDIDLKSFLNSICFEKVSEEKLISETLKILIEEYSLNNGTEKQYLKALFYHIFWWSKSRETVTQIEINNAIQKVTDSFSKAPTNPAIQNSWITPVDFVFEDLTKDLGYFDGKAARPIHIAQELPVKRKGWEERIMSNINSFDTTVIKSSSGQGKSTLLWQVSYLLNSQEYSIYELNRCQEWNDVIAIKDFIISRLKIGQLPIVVIDGLNHNTSSFQELISELIGFPIKFLITAREEDWYRYGADNSKVKLKILEVSLSQEEAKSIFIQLKSKGKIHSSIKNWETVWEQVKEKGLLIEYVYLLTKGQLLKDRLEQQVKTLNTEVDSGTKIEILRLISIADVLNLKLETLKLTQYIQKTIGFNTDRGEVLKQLEEEYYVKFDHEFVEGLHPVRSKHLVDLLHSTIPISESLLNLFQIINSDSIYDYFISVPILVPENSKENFYSKFAKKLASHKFSDMVYAIDGLMHSEPYRFWEKNKEVFDQVFEMGGIVPFISGTLPFSKVNTLEVLSEVMKDVSSNFEILSGKLNALSKYDIANSDITLFANKLSKELKVQSTEITSYEGLGFLVKWFKQLSIPINLNIEINNENLLQIFNTSSISESSELFSFLNISEPKEYSSFIKKNKNLIISKLKKETNSLSIEERGKDIHIEYLLDDNADKANEYSVYRIQVMYNFLPNYEKYCTKAIILPFPNEDLYKVVVQNSIKAMPRENISDTFDVHINQIWNQTILDQYRSASSFEWQEQLVNVRKKGLEFAKISVRYFEALVEKNESRIRSSFNKLIETGTNFAELLRVRQKYPRSTQKYFEEEAFIDEQKAINDWCSSLNNFLNQIGGIIQPKSSNDRNLAAINLKSAVYKLNLMQGSFNKVAKETYQYFSTEELSREETNWYERLLRSVLFYVVQIADSPEKNVSVAKTVIQSWWVVRNEERLKQIHAITKEFEKESYFTFHLPNKILEDETLKNVVIGVEGIENDYIDDDLFELLSGLNAFSSTDIDFFTFINISEREAYGAFRVNREFFHRVQTAIETGEFEEIEYGNPIPINIDEQLINCLDNISIKKVKVENEDEAFTQVMFNIWKLQEYRQRLNKENPIEHDWLNEIESEYQESIVKHLDKIMTIDGNLQQLIKEFMLENRTFEKDEIVEYLNERVQVIQL